MVKPKISIITVVLNAAEDLRRTRLSLQAQKQDWVEWIVVDGGSTDGTLMEIDASGPLVDNLVSENDNGIYDAMNKGWRAAGGDFLWYVNAGDEIFPNAIERLNEVVGSWSKDCIYCGPWLVNLTDGRQILKKPNPSELKFRMAVSHQAILHPRQAIMGTSMYDTRFRLAADYDLFLRASLRGVSFKNLDFPLIIYHKGGRTDQSPIQSKFETVVALWRARSDRRWRGTFKYLNEVIKILLERFFRFFC